MGNLIMREWESFFTKNTAGRSTAEYRHALMPHARSAEMNNAARLRAAAGFTQPLLCRVDAPHAGDLPPSKSFLRVTPRGRHAFRVPQKAVGAPDSASWKPRARRRRQKRACRSREPSKPIYWAAESGEVSRRESSFLFHVDPWKIRTFEANF